MFNFFFKKNFYDGWDNVLLETVPNILFDIFLFLAGFSFFLSAKLNMASKISNFQCLAIWTGVALVLFVVGSIIVLSWALSAREIASYEAPQLRDFFARLPSVVCDGVLYGLLLFFTTVVTIIGLCYYFRLIPKRSSGGLWYIGVQEGEQLPFIGLVAGSVFLWVVLTIYQMLFLYPAVRAVIPCSFNKAIKKCFVIFLDNLFACIGLAIHNLFLFALSLVMLGLLPGIGGLGLARVNFVRLIIKKYDWDGNKNTKKLPWADILQDDIAATGNRTLKTFFFPWKDN